MTIETLQPYPGTFCSRYGFYNPQTQQTEFGYNCGTIQTINENGEVDGTLAFHILVGSDGTGLFQNGSIIKSNLSDQIVFTSSNFTGSLSAYSPIECAYVTQRNCFAATVTGDFSGIYPDGTTLNGSVKATVKRWFQTGRFEHVTKYQVNDGTLPAPTKS